MKSNTSFFLRNSLTVRKSKLHIQCICAAMNATKNLPITHIARMLKLITVYCTALRFSLLWLFDVYECVCVHVHVRWGGYKHKCIHYFLMVATFSPGMLRYLLLLLFECVCMCWLLNFKRYFLWKTKEKHMYTFWYVDQIARLSLLNAHTNAHTVENQFDKIILNMYAASLFIKLKFIGYKSTTKKNACLCLCVCAYESQNCSIHLFAECMYRLWDRSFILLFFYIYFLLVGIQDFILIHEGRARTHARTNNQHKHTSTKTNAHTHKFTCAWNGRPARQMPVNTFASFVLI